MRWIRTRLASLALSCALAPIFADEPDKPSAPASEQNPSVPAPGHSLHGEAFDEGPRQQAYLKDGQGHVDFLVTTASPEAQKFINQGVGQLHSFYYLEAERSFRQAARLDPSCAMSYWGMAMANVNNTKRAAGFAKEAQEKAAAGSVSPREQLYLDALAALYKDGGKHDPEFLTGMEAVVQECPEDPDARAWLAMLIWQNENVGPSRQAVDGLLEYVEKAEPLHPGAHHYRIHLWDGKKPERALRSAALYATTAPGIAHAWHMPGHTYTGLKRYADAAYQQEGSARVDHSAMTRDRIMPFEIHNYAHNNQWLATSLGHEGRYKDALAVARNLVEQPRDPQKNNKDDGGSAQRSGRLRWAETLAKFELWDDLIAATESGTMDWSDVRQEKAERAYFLGLAHAAQGDKAKLAKQVEALRALLPAPNPETPKADRPKETPATPKPPPGPESELAELEGYRKLLDDDVAGAFESFGKAKKMRGEALARAHVRARNFGFAPGVARKAAEDNANQVVPLAAYVEVLAACGKTDEAREQYRKLDALARDADRDAPVFARLEPIVASWRAGGWEPGDSHREAETPSEHRIDLTTLGDLTWAPFPAEAIQGADTSGKAWDLADHSGRKVLAVFYLGGQCAHCMQQLQAIGTEVEAFRALNTDVVAIGTDAPEGTKLLKRNEDGVEFPMPLLSDPTMDLFRRHRAYDDFEGLPMHATLLIDGQGKVRFQRIGPEPFLDVDFLKAEAARMDRLP